MWKRRKFIVIAVLAAVVLAGSIVGVAFAQTGTGTTTSGNTLLARVVAILNQQGVNIDQAKLQGAFDQARQEQRDAAQDKYLSDQVAAGKLSQAQADQYKTWVKARPDVPAFGPGKSFGMRGPGGRWGGWNCPGTPAPSPTPTK